MKTLESLRAINNKRNAFFNRFIQYCNIRSTAKNQNRLDILMLLYIKEQIKKQELVISECDDSLYGTNMSLLIEYTNKLRAVRELIK